MLFEISEELHAFLSLDFFGIRKGAEGDFTTDGAFAFAYVD
jgi:hypothetical protein